MDGWMVEFVGLGIWHMRGRGNCIFIKKDPPM